MKLPLVSFKRQGITKTTFGTKVSEIDGGIFIHDDVHTTWSGYPIIEEPQGSEALFLEGFPEIGITLSAAKAAGVDFIFFPGKWVALPTSGEYAFLAELPNKEMN